VPRVGSLAETGDVWEPRRLLDPAGRGGRACRGVAAGLAGGRADTRTV